MAVSVVSFSFSWFSIKGPGPTLLGDLLYLISNFSGPQTLSGFPRPFGLMWLSLPHLVYNSVWCLTGIRTQLSWLMSWLSYIIVQRPLDLWNRMFDRHQAEITVMQFTGHSLPVRQSMGVPWEFFTSTYFIIPPTVFPLKTAIRMCHFFPVHHLGMAFLAGSKAKIQQQHKSPINSPIRITCNLLLKDISSNIK